MGIIPFFLGVVAMQLVYLTYHFLLFRKKDFLYYALFTFCFTLFFSFLTVPPLQELGKRITNGNLFLSAVTFIMFGASLYYKFVRHFAELDIHHPTHSKIIRIAEIVLFSCGSMILIDTIILNRKLDFIYPIFRVIYFINIIIQTYTIFILLRSGKLLNLILGIGSIVMAMFVKLGILPIILVLNTKLAAFNTFSYVFTGLIFNFLFFNFALIYKSRNIENEKTALEVQKQTELFKQRNEIANDLHDDIGASLSSLHVYSTIVEKEIERNPDLARKYLNKIASGIRMVMENMNDVIWAVNAQKKDAKLFSSRLKDFNMDMFDAKNIECTYNIDPALERKITRMLVRKNLLLISKEAINNVVKHSQASKVSIHLKEENDHLLLEIEDNGVGMIAGKLTSGGHGLHSLEVRTQQLGGELLITNKPDDQGVMVRTTIPLANISD